MAALSKPIRRAFALEFLAALSVATAVVRTLLRRTIGPSEVWEAVAGVADALPVSRARVQARLEVAVIARPFILAEACPVVARAMTAVTRTRQFVIAAVAAEPLIVTGACQVLQIAGPVARAATRSNFRCPGAHERLLALLAVPAKVALAYKRVLAARPMPTAVPLARAFAAGAVVPLVGGLASANATVARAVPRAEVGAV